MRTLRPLALRTRHTLEPLAWNWSHWLLSLEHLQRDLRRMGERRAWRSCENAARASPRPPPENPLLPKVNIGSTFAVRRPHYRLLSRCAALFQVLRNESKGLRSPGPPPANPPAHAPILTPRTYDSRCENRTLSRAGRPAHCRERDSTGFPSCDPVLMRNRPPPWTVTGPCAQAYCRVLGGGWIL